MPELPEVEVAARNLRRWTAGRVIRGSSTTGATRLLRPGSAAALRQLTGARFTEVRRVGKNLLLTLERGGRGKENVGVWSHLGMTGKWLRRRRGGVPPAFSRVRLDLDDAQTLHYCDMRLFGRFRLVAGARFDDLPELVALGRDPWTEGIDADDLHRRLSRMATPIKVAIMDQRLLPGVGNIQASEALFRARLDPRRAARTLSRAEVGRLARGILASLRYTIDRFEAEGADSDTAEIRYVEEPRAPNPFWVYGRAGDRCRRRPHASIQRIVQAQRSTFFCPVCQGTPARRA
jgi:formamidopyrimidine-DNA glycosylase